MPRKSIYDVLFYCAGVFALAAATCFVLILLANVFTFILSLTEHYWLYDIMVDYVVSASLFSHFLLQTLCIAVFFFLAHYVWKRVLKR